MMTAEDILKEIAKGLKDNSELSGNIFQHELFGSVLYDPERLDRKVGLAIMEETPNGLRKRFHISVEDMIGIEE